MKIGVAAAVVVLVFLALDALALHDILAREPDITLETLAIGASLVSFTFLGIMLLRRYRHRTAPFT